MGSHFCVAADSHKIKFLPTTMGDPGRASTASQKAAAEAGIDWDKWLKRGAFYLVYYIFCWYLGLGYLWCYSNFMGLPYHDEASLDKAHPDIKYYAAVHPEKSAVTAKPYSQARLTTPVAIVVPVSNVRETSVGSQQINYVNFVGNHGEATNERKNYQDAFDAFETQLGYQKDNSTVSTSFKNDVTSFCGDARKFTTNEFCFFVGLSKIINWEPTEDVYVNCEAFRTKEGKAGGSERYPDYSQPLAQTGITWRNRNPGDFPNFSSPYLPKSKFPFKGYEFNNGKIERYERPIIMMKIDMNDGGPSSRHFVCQATAGNIITPVYKNGQYVLPDSDGNDQNAAKHVHLSFTIVT